MEKIMTEALITKGKLLIKGLIIGGLALLLIIPTLFVQELVREREDTQKTAFAEISSKWAGKQNIMGPVLVLPYSDTVETGGKTSTIEKTAYILPDTLNIESNVTPQKRHRGIYQVMLYSATTHLAGSFKTIPLEQLGINAAQVHWKEAFVCVTLGDVKGLKEDISLHWNETDIQFNPSRAANAVMKEGFTAPVTVSLTTSNQFSATINTNGSEQLSFTPIGKQTTATLTSTWKAPSFNGDLLPDYKLDKTGFTATWKSLATTRKFPQAWKESSYDLSAASFGANLFIAVNGYQKIMRSVKYAALCILLTFAAFYLIETVNKKSVHPLQYGLIGIALVLFLHTVAFFFEYTGC